LGKRYGVSTLPFSGVTFAGGLFAAEPRTMPGCRCASISLKALDHPFAPAFVAPRLRHWLASFPYSSAHSQGPGGFEESHEFDISATLQIFDSLETRSTGLGQVLLAPSLCRASKLDVLADVLGKLGEIHQFKDWLNSAHKIYANLQF
jgi:hypothetical protein